MRTRYYNIELKKERLIMSSRLVLSNTTNVPPTTKKTTKKTTKEAANKKKEHVNTSPTKVSPHVTPTKPKVAELRVERTIVTPDRKQAELPELVETRQKIKFGTPDKKQWVGSFSFNSKQNIYILNGEEVAKEKLLGSVDIKTTLDSDIGLFSTPKKIVAELVESPPEIKVVTPDGKQWNGSFTFNPKHGVYILDGKEVAKEELLLPQPREEEDSIATLTGFSDETIEFADISYAEAKLAKRLDVDDPLSIASIVTQDIFERADMNATARIAAAGAQLAAVTAKLHCGTAEEAAKRAETADAHATSQRFAAERGREETKAVVQDYKSQMQTLKARVEDAEANAKGHAADATQAFKETEALLVKSSVYYENMQKVGGEQKREFAASIIQVGRKIGLVEGMRDQTAHTFEQMAEMFEQFRLEVRNEKTELEDIRHKFKSEKAELEQQRVELEKKLAVISAAEELKQKELKAAASLKVRTDNRKMRLKVFLIPSLLRLIATQPEESKANFKELAKHIAELYIAGNKTIEPIVTKALNGLADLSKEERSDNIVDAAVEGVTEQVIATLSGSPLLSAFTAETTGPATSTIDTAALINKLVM